MKKMLLALAVLATTFLTAGVGIAEAGQGCGYGWHRSPYGNCRPNGWRAGRWHRGGWHRRWYRRW